MQRSAPAASATLKSCTTNTEYWSNTGAAIRQTCKPDFCSDRQSRMIPVIRSCVTHTYSLILSHTLSLSHTRARALALSLAQSAHSAFSCLQLSPSLPTILSTSPTFFCAFSQVFFCPSFFFHFSCFFRFKKPGVCLFRNRPSRGGCLFRNRQSE